MSDPVSERPFTPLDLGSARAETDLGVCGKLLDQACDEIQVLRARQQRYDETFGLSAEEVDKAVFPEMEDGIIRSGRVKSLRRLLKFFRTRAGFQVPVSTMPEPR